MLTKKKWIPAQRHCGNDIKRGNLVVKEIDTKKTLLPCQEETCRLLFFSRIEDELAVLDFDKEKILLCLAGAGERRGA